MVKFKSGDYLLCVNQMKDFNVLEGDIGICEPKEYHPDHIVGVRWIYRKDGFNKIMDGGYYKKKFKKVSKEWVDLFMLGK